MQLLTIRAAGFTATGGRLRPRRRPDMVPVAAGEPAERARPLGPPGQGRDRLDHVIIGDGRFVSLKEQGVM